MLLRVTDCRNFALAPDSAGVAVAADQVRLLTGATLRPDRKCRQAGCGVDKPAARERKSLLARLPALTRRLPDAGSGVSRFGIVARYQWRQPSLPPPGLGEPPERLTWESG